VCVNKFAYTPGVGTRNALKAVLKKMKEYKLRYGRVFWVLLDLSKAFDMLDYRQIVPTLCCDEVTKRVLVDFLTKCTIIIGQEPPIRCKRGVRQGGLISPNLFNDVANAFLVDFIEAKLGFLPGYADDFLPVSPSAAWIQDVVQKFADFCVEKGLVINPTKCKAMVSTTIAFAEKGLALPTFTVNGVEIEYTDKAKFLGFSLTTTLASDDHMDDILRKLRVAILSFKCTMRIRKLSILLRIARTFIVPTLHNLDFVERLKNAHITKFEYLMATFFGVKVQNLDSIRQGKKWLYLQDIHAEARRRYEQDY